MKFTKWQLPFILWTLTILVLTWYPKVEIPDIGINAEDKIAHMIVFSLWGVLMLRMLSKNEINRFSFAVKLLIISGVVFAVIDESVQAMIPGRFFTIYDMLANVIGVLVSPLLFRFLHLPVVQRFSQTQD